MLASKDHLDKIIRNRRSIRKYGVEMPPADWIEAMIACAVWAPSPSNSQPVRFVRIVSLEIRNDLHCAMIQRHQELLQMLESEGGSKKTKNLLNAYLRYSEFMFKAPVIIAVGTVTNFYGFSRRLTEARVLPEDTGGETDLDISVGLALMGLLLKGEALGLGTCILTAPLVFLTDVEKRIGLEDMRIKCFVTIGFADEPSSSIERRSLADVFWEI